MCTPPKKKVFSCPSSSSSTTFGKVPPHKSQFFYQFQDVHPFLYKAQTMNEEVLWVQVYAASNGCTHGQGHGENLSLSSAHVHIAPSLWLLMWIDLFVVLQAIASLRLKYRKQISLCVCVCMWGVWGWEADLCSRDDFVWNVIVGLPPCHLSGQPCHRLHAIPCCQMQPK